MLSFFKDSKPYQIAFWGLIALITLLTIYTPDFLYLRFWSRYAVQIMFSLLLLGLISMMLRDPKSMYVSFICCGLLCYSLRSREPFYAPRENDTVLTVAHIKLNQENPQGVVNVILKYQPDVVTFQEFVPTWGTFFKEDSLFQTIYPHDTSLFNMTIHSPAVYSKYPMKIGTFYHEEAPNIVGSIEKDGQLFNFIKLSTTPPVNMDAFKKIGNHLAMVADTVNALQAPVVVLGNYNVVQKSTEIFNFKKRGHLMDSRSDSKLFLMPYDHIFYNEDLVCIGFNTLSDPKSGDKLGIMGQYQINRQLHEGATQKAVR